MNLPLLALAALVGIYPSTFAGGLRLERVTKRAPEAPIALWPGVAPGDTGNIGEEKDTTKPGQDPANKYIIRLGNVTKPTITVYKPPKEKDTGAAVVVCPGGGYYILAMDLEGTEVCQWLNSIGVTGILLKYRVPVRQGRERYAAPLQDSQRAMGLVRQHASEWGIDPNRIGILGFSAGGHLTAATSTNYDSRTYPPIDDADKLSCRPDFSILIYPAYISKTDGAMETAPEIKVTSKTPPAFIVMSQDDPVHVESAMAYFLALKNAKVPSELHLYPSGGHGYGLRPTEQTVTRWPERAAEWLKSQGWLKAKN